MQVNRNDIIATCQRLREEVVQPLSNKYNACVDVTSVQSTQLPMVLLLGNHSSGKSSLINHLLQRPVQASGVAPTDDSFTVIAPGPEDADRAGPAFIGDTSLGFQGLSSFGKTLIHKTQLKIRKLAPDVPEQRRCSGFYLVDTPGMIDSPIKANASHAERIMDRGYDFEGVVRWYAERADLILLLFDPEKPGTTGETLHCLVNSLQGADHKLHIVMNKADKFHRISDFARAYGTLCWNLSKVIPRKDVPQIFCTCLPGASAVQDELGDSGDESKLFTHGLESLVQARQSLENEVFAAPGRRVDNEISRLTEATRLTQLHCHILDDVVSRYQNAVFWARAKMVSALCGSAALVSSAWWGVRSLSTPRSARALQGGLRVVGAAAMLGAGGCATLYYFQRRALEVKSRSLSSLESFTQCFQRRFARQIAAADQYSAYLWDLMKNHLAKEEWKIEQLDRVSTKDLESLSQILNKELPALRKKAAPLMDVNSSHATSGSVSLGYASSIIEVDTPILSQAGPKHLGNHTVYDTVTTFGSTSMSIESGSVAEDCD